jgi:hypothetical protein
MGQAIVMFHRPNRFRLSPSETKDTREEKPMNSKSLPYHETAQSVIELPALPRRQTLATLARTVIRWFTRSDLEQARAHYRAKRDRAAQAGTTRDIVSALPLDEKQRLGLHQMID